MTKAKRRTFGVVALLALGLAWYCGSCVAWGSMRVLVGAVSICASIGAFCAACWMGGYLDG